MKGSVCAQRAEGEQRPGSGQEEALPEEIYPKCAPIPPAAPWPSQEAFPRVLVPFRMYSHFHRATSWEKLSGKSALSAEPPLRGTQLGLILEDGGY